MIHITPVERAAILRLLAHHTPVKGDMARIEGVLARLVYPALKDAVAQAETPRQRRARWKHFVAHWNHHQARLAKNP